MRYFSLFNGIGGFELGIEEAIRNLRPIKSAKTTRPNKINSIKNQLGEWQCVGYSEIDKYAIQIYQKHFPTHKNYGDAKRIIWEEVPDFELLCAGFPCQSFSIAGKRGGFEDTRGTLFFEIARAIRIKRPELLLLENVKGLLSHDKGRTFGTILATLSELGHILEWQVLNSKDFGVPQNRERVFIIGYIRERGRPKVFPIGESSPIFSGCRKKRTIKSGISSTVTANLKRGVHSQGETYITEGIKIRRLTPTECERLQGFPDGWTEGISDTQRYKCLGNAVTVNVIMEIVKRLVKEANNAN